MEFSLFTADQYRNFLKKLISASEASLEGAPLGSLKINRSNGHVWYCQRVKGEERAIYIPKNDINLKAALAQKDYDRKILKLLTNAQLEFASCGNVLSSSSIDDVFNSLCRERRDLVTPVIPTDEQFIKAWLERPYEKKGFRSDDTGCFYTDNGERVRSKAEIIIADNLKQAGLPYIYECPLVLGSRVIHPDFTVMDMRLRREVYFEHFGMMDNPQYVKGFLWKLNWYESHGIILGRDLIFTVESQDCVLDTRLLKRKIRGAFFDPPLPDLEVMWSDGRLY